MAAWQGVLMVRRWWDPGLLRSLSRCGRGKSRLLVGAGDAVHEASGLCCGGESFGGMMLSGRNWWHGSPGPFFPPGLGGLGWGSWPGWTGIGSDELRPCDCLCYSNLDPFTGYLLPKLT